MVLWDHAALGHEEDESRADKLSISLSFATDVFVLVGGGVKPEAFLAEAADGRDATTADTKGAGCDISVEVLPHAEKDDGEDDEKAETQERTDHDGFVDP